MFKIKKKSGKQKPTVLYNIVEDYSEFDAPGNVTVCAMTLQEDLSAHAKVLSESYEVPLETMTKLLAEGGVSGLLQDKEAGESRLLAETAGYDGPGKLAWGQGAAWAQGRDYTLTASRVEAHLDAQRRVERYEATGEARLVGKDYDGEGDRLLYTPATRSGEAFRKGRDAVVVQKEPYRRLSAPVVRFAPSRAETLAGGTPSRRGRLEGQAPVLKTEAPKGPKAPGKPMPGKGP